VSALREPTIERPPSTPAPSPSRRYQSLGYRAKKLLLGPALKTSQLSNERVSKRVALAVFSSTRSPRPPTPPRRSCSSWSGAPWPAGPWPPGWPCRWPWPSSPCWPCWWSPTVRWSTPTRRPAGPYVVSRDNFGNVTAAVAGAALLIDYVLTVAVSVSSGVAAMASVWPDQLGPLRVELSVGLRGPARLGEPARHPRGRQDLRHPHLCVRGQRGRDDPGRGLAAGRRRPRTRSSYTAAQDGPAPPRGRRRGRSPCSWSCGPSPRARPPSPGSRPSPTGSRPSAAPRPPTPRRP
jgi:hypothetical protein